MILIDALMPVAGLLLEEGVPVGGQSGRIPPVRMALVNLMPDKIGTELQFLRLLGQSGRPVSVDFIRMGTHRSKGTPSDYLKRFYKTLDQIQNNRYDGLIITGAPVEKLEFEQVDYWEELTRLMEWSKRGADKILYICWGAQAGLYHHFGIQKKTLPEKLSGVFGHERTSERHPALKGLSLQFKGPHSRWAHIDESRLAQEPRLQVLARSKEAGSHIITDIGGRHLFLLGHMEYEADTLAKEYFRDLEKGWAPKVPRNYFPENNPKNPPSDCWREVSEQMFKNWLGTMAGREKKVFSE